MKTKSTDVHTLLAEIDRLRENMARTGITRIDAAYAAEELGMETYR